MEFACITHNVQCTVFMCDCAHCSVEYDMFSVHVQRRHSVQIRIWSHIDHSQLSRLQNARQKSANVFLSHR